MILLYRVLSTLIYPLLFIYIFIRKLKKKEHPIRFKEKILTSHFNVIKKKTKLIWFHASSVGEFKSILPIIEELNINNNYEFLISTTTYSSSTLAQEELKKFDNVYHRFFPFDVGFLINKFLLLWKPDVIFLVDSEIWPNLILKANKLKIPLILINARITSKSFKKWMLFPSTAKNIFNLFNLCLASNLETKNFLEKLNAKNIYLNGNIKFTNKLDKKNIKNLNYKILTKNRFWLAASTHEGEEVLCIKSHLKLKDKYKKMITIIAPRHIERVQKIAELCKSYDLDFQILNKNEVFSEEKEIIIINSFGVLQEYFKFAKSVFIGKSTLKKLENEGGQNPIDAAKLGCKIYHGPYVYNFKEIYELLKQKNISKEIKDYTDLSKYLIEDLNKIQNKDKEILYSIDDLGQKILNDTINILNNILHNEIK
jgi:3-deoxy-D-manno-octulosonic-acid transferase